LNAQLIGLDQGSAQSDAFIAASCNKARSTTQNVFFLYILETPGLVLWLHKYFRKCAARTGPNSLNTSRKGPIGAVIQGNDTKGWAVGSQKLMLHVDFLGINYQKSNQLSATPPPQTLARDNKAWQIYLRMLGERGKKNQVRAHNIQILGMP